MANHQRPKDNTNSKAVAKVMYLRPDWARFWSKGLPTECQEISDKDISKIIGSWKVCCATALQPRGLTGRFEVPETTSKLIESVQKSDYFLSQPRAKLGANRNEILRTLKNIESG